MRPIYEWDAFRPNIIMDLPLAMLFGLISMTFAVFQIFIVFALGFIITENNIPFNVMPFWFISPALNLTFILTIALMFTILAQQIVGYSLIWYKKKYIDGWL